MKTIRGRARVRARRFVHPLLASLAWVFFALPISADVATNALRSRQTSIEDGPAAGQAAGKSLPVIATTKRDGVYVSKGYIDVKQNSARVGETLAGLGRYNEWALKGLDGSDPISAKYIGLITDVEPCGGNRVLVRYDIVLPWPLGSMENQAYFTMATGSIPGSMRFVSESKTLAYDWASFSFEPSPTAGGGTRVDFFLEMKFAWFIDPFLTEALYQEGIGWRAGRVAKNLAARCSE